MSKTIEKILKGVTVAALGLSSMLFQANGCSINVSGLDQVLSGLEGVVGDIAGEDFGSLGSYEPVSSEPWSYGEDFGDCDCSYDYGYDNTW